MLSYALKLTALKPSALKHSAVAVLAASLLACANAKPEDEPMFRGPPVVGGGEGGAGGGGVGGGIIDDITVSSFVFYQVGADGYMASAAGTEPRLICDNAKPQPSADGTRVLCVPESDENPLVLYDVANDLALIEIADWHQSDRSPPRLSADGARVALRTFDDRFRSLVRVVNDSGVQVAETRAEGLIAFPREDVLIVDLNQPAVWRIGMDPVPVTGSNAYGIGPEPAGMAYESRSNVFFRDADDNRSIEIAEGNLAAAYADRILVLRNPPEPGPKIATLHDVDDLDYAEDVPMPRVSFDRVLATRLVGRNTVIAEVQRFATCANRQSRVATLTTWYNVNRAEAFEVESTEEGHFAKVDSRGEKALILDLDACGNPTGTGRVKNLRSGEVTSLVEFVQGAISAATLSDDGRFLGVATADGVLIVDLASSPPLMRPAGMGAPGGTEIIFR